MAHEAAEHERRFQGAAERLRAPARLALMEVPRVVDLCLAAPGCASVLDVGTGTGIWAEAFASRGLSSAGVEQNPELLASAVSLVTGVDFRKGSAESLPWAAASFDLVFLGHVLHETDEPLAALAEARRVARVRVAVLEWPYREEDSGPPLAHRLQPERVVALAEQAGYTEIERLALAHMDFYRLTP